MVYVNQKYKVYVHITPSNKFYVGITRQPVKRRWRNGKGYNSYFSNAIEKYGWDNIEHCIIAENLTEEEAVNFEKILIEKLRSNEKEFGYNITIGGEGVHGYTHPPEVIEKLRELSSGENNPMYGVSLVGRSGKDNPMYGKPAHNRKAVECITTGVTFKTVTEAGKYYGTHKSDINKVCTGRRTYAGELNGEKLKWRYVDGNC